MSRELIFYPAVRNKDTNKYYPILYDNEGVAASVFWRSGSFIEEDYFTSLPMIKVEELSEDFSFLSYMIDEFHENTLSYVYVLSEAEMLNNNDKGIISGYVPIEEVNSYYESDYPQDYLYYDMSTPIRPEVFIEMPDEEKKKYMKFFAIDEYSRGYICSILLEIIDDIYIPSKDEELCYVVDYSF